MYPYLGDFELGKTIFIPFHTFNSSGASVTITGLAVTDIEIYKNASMTQRSSDNGYSLTDTDGIDLDGITGIHGFTIDTSDNTDAGFYAAGNDYTVVVSSITADGQTVNFIAGRFSLINRVNAITAFTLLGPYPHLGILESGTMQAGSTSTTAVLRSATSFADDVPLGVSLYIYAGTGAGQTRFISDYVGATDTATVDTAWQVTPDNTSQYIAFVTGYSTSGGGSAPSAATVAAAVWDSLLASFVVSGSAGERLGRIPNVASGANGGLPTLDANLRVSANTTAFGGTALTQTGGRPEVNTTHFGGSALTQTGGRPEVNTTHAAGTAWGSGAITAGSIAAGAITNLKFDSGALDANALATDAATEIATAVAAISLAEPSAVFTWPGTLQNVMAYLGAKASNRQTETATTYTLRNRANSATIATATVSDDATTAVKGSDV